MLDLIAHPIALWILGLVGGLLATIRHRDESRRITPWGWVARHPGRVARALIGSILILGIFHAAGWLDSQPVGGALAAGAGALGTEGLDAVLQWTRSAVRSTLKRLPGKGA